VALLRDDGLGNEPELRSAFPRILTISATAMPGAPALGTRSRLVVQTRKEAAGVLDSVGNAELFELLDIAARSLRRRSSTRRCSSMSS
jgi:hypothetical protein